jgi:hypothetical protein
MPDGDWVLEGGTLVVTSAEKRTFGGESDFQILATDPQGCGGKSELEPAGSQAVGKISWVKKSCR